MKRILEKLEAVARSSRETAPTEPRGEAAKYLRDLIAKAERGELKGKPATDEKKNGATWLEVEVTKIANRLKRGAKATGAHDPVRAHNETNPTGADDESPEELLTKLIRKLASGKVH